MANIFKAKTLVVRTGNFSHEVTAPNLVYNTGDQIISGNKTFKGNILVEGTGIFNSVDLSNISEFQFSGTNINLIDSNVYVSGDGWIYISGKPVITGSPELSLLNLNNIVFTTGDQTIIGLKDFDNKINVSGIKFDVLTTAQVPAHQEGLLYYSDDDKTLNLDTDITDLSLPIGQENWVRAKNLTNSTITPGTVVYITGAQGNTPLVQRSLATSDGQSAGTMGVAAHSINNNSKGYFTTFGLVENINTSAYPVGTTLYLSWETSGGFTGVKPQAPNHLVRIGNVIDQGNNGSIFVTIQNGFEVDELHDVRIINPQNKDGIIYNSGSGLWLNTPTALANEVVYNTGNQTISGNKTFINNQIFSGSIDVSGTGIFNAIDLNNIDTLSLSGIDISITGSTVNVFGNIFISGNPVLTGIPDANWASQAEINSLSGSVVFLTGNQTINGLKTFTSGIDIYSGTSPQSIRVFNTTGTNSGEFALIGWQNNNLIIGTQQSQSGFLRDLTLTGNNININASGALNIFDNTNILGTLYVGGDGHEQSAISIRGIDGITKILNTRDKNGENGFFVQGEIGTDLLIQMGDVDGADNSAYLSFDQANALCKIENATLEVNGNVKFGSVGGGTPTLYMYDGANGYYNRITWAEKELVFRDDPDGANQVFSILYNDNANGELTLYSNLGVNGTRLIFPSGKQGYIAIDSELVHKTGNEIISGVKTFIGNHIISGNTTISGSINISGNYDIYSQIENAKKLAIAYAIAL